MPALQGGSNANSYALVVGGVNYTTWADVTATFWTESGAEVPAEFECVIASGERSNKTLTAGFDFTGVEVSLQDTGNDRKLWGGFVDDMEMSHGTGPVVYYHLRAVSWDSLLDRQSIVRWRSAVNVTAKRVRWMETDREMVQSLVSQYGYDLVANNTNVASTNSNMPKLTLKSLTLRDALQAVADAASSVSASTELRRFYVDFDKKVHYFKTNEGTSAPYKIGNAEYDGSTIVPDYITYSKNVTDAAKKVYIKGSNKKGTDWITKGTSRQYDRADIIDVPESDNAAACKAFGAAYLSREGAPVRGGSFSVTGYDGWRAGQTVNVRDSAFGLNENFQIREIQATPNFGNGVTTYDIAYGALPFRGTDMLPRKKRSTAATGRGGSSGGGGGGGGSGSGTGSDGSSDSDSGSSSGGGGCFVAGTMVLTPSGEKAIETITEGDAVLTLDGIGHVSGLRNRTENTTPRVEVTLEDGRHIEATDGHPFWTGTDWKAIGEFRPGELVFDFALGPVRIDSMTFLGNDPTDVYNFEVEPQHSYLVAGGIAVHNITQI